MEKDILILGLMISIHLLDQNRMEEFGEKLFYGSEKYNVSVFWSTKHDKGKELKLSVVLAADNPILFDFL